MNDAIKGFSDDSLREFMDIASMGKLDSDLPDFSIFPNQDILYAYPRKDPVFPLIKPQQYFSDWKPQMARAKRHFIYEALFAAPEIQETVERYLLLFPTYQHSLLDEFEKGAYLEYGKLQTFAELTYYYRLHTRDVSVASGNFDSSFQPKVKRARENIEELEDAVESLQESLSGVDFSLLQMKDEEEVFLQQLMTFRSTFKSRKNDLGIVRRTSNKTHPDRLLVARVGYSLTRGYGKEIPDFTDLVHNLCKPALENAKIKPGKIEEYLETIPVLVSQAESNKNR
ncbi:hypothetical protein HBA55_26050 [Pseudomaricurvus alkylphenolicus]|uniref:hypothetical protein n=1 Tax=Pseudomaricurvus alkylphenolicus TaxID=1306991 RepID=UPI001422FE66|nr:hypothetical protein [Pseudomaricurvus alkylphenolicus]NIB43099.1 hypothetical protein [Pseudomaricurvus alkylphenolicus]